MKNIVNYLKNINEGHINESRFEIDECNAKGNMKFGFMRYDENRGVVDILQFNKLSDFASYEGFDEEDYLGIDNLKVGETAYDGASYIYTRIW